MAATKKYAGLPDLDLGTEIYETVLPELTEGSSVGQTSTLATEFNGVSDDDNPNLVRHGLNREQARRRFEPAVVDARDVNFSDTIAGTRRDYKTGHRRRRRRRRVVENSTEESDDFLSDESEDDETLRGKLARLRREAEEVKAEIARLENARDNDDGEFKDSVEQQSQEEGQELLDGVEEVCRILEGLNASTRSRNGQTLEEEISRQLNGGAGQNATGKIVGRPKAEAREKTQDSSSLPAIAAFADRLTALETVLGVSSISPGTTTSILPTLETLSSQINILSATLSPRSHPTGTSLPITGDDTPTNTSHLDQIGKKLQILQSECSRLEASRRSATKSLEELIQVRDNAAKLAPAGDGFDIFRRRPLHSSQPTSTTNNVEDGPTKEIAQFSATTTTNFFLDEQASKITALYNVLPTIQNLQPLLPVVLERLRALSAIHAGAASAANDLEGIERRLELWGKDLRKWRQAVEGVETGMQENKEVMRENVQVIGDMVREVEERLDRVQRAGRG